MEEFGYASEEHGEFYHFLAPHPGRPVLLTLMSGSFARSMEDVEDEGSLTL
jgi:hypothetical protein